MNRASKVGIIVLILILSIGFATITTNLIINGSSKVATNVNDFDVYFSSVSSEIGGEAELSNNNRTITYNTKQLSIVGDKAGLYFTVFNNSSQYDANVSVTYNVVNVKDGKDYSEYFTISRYGFASSESDYIDSKQTKDGSLIIELKKAYIGEDVELEFSIELDVNAVERTTPGVESANNVVEGTIYDSLGQPMRNASFAAFSDPVFFKTDDNGHYSVRLPEGKHHVYYIPDKTVEDLVKIENDWQKNEKIMVDGVEQNYRNVYSRIKFYDNVRSAVLDLSESSNVRFSQYRVGDTITIGTDEFIYLETKANGNMLVMTRYPVGCSSSFHWEEPDDEQFVDEPQHKCDMYSNNISSYVYNLRESQNQYEIINGRFLSTELFETYFLTDGTLQECIENHCDLGITLTARKDLEGILDKSIYLAESPPENSELEENEYGDIDTYEMMAYYIDSRNHTISKGYQSGDVASVVPVLEVRLK